MSYCYRFYASGRHALVQRRERACLHFTVQFAKTSLPKKERQRITSWSVNSVIAASQLSISQSIPEQHSKEFCHFFVHSQYSFGTLATDIIRSQY
jgi:hypothetical protein